MHNIINGAKDALNATILLGGVWAQHADDGAMSEEERAGRGVIKLTAVVTMDGLDGGAKLCVRIGKKIGQNIECLGFEAKRKGPSVMGAVIKNNKIVFVT